MLWSLSLLAAGTAAKILYAGVNESGGEFGTWSNDAIPTTGLPGRFGVDYAFINKSTVDIFVEKDKINTFRVAFLLERMCPLSYGLGSKFNETYFGYFKEAIDYITLTKGAYAILDPHNYMRYNNPSQQPTTGSIIGDSSDIKAATTAQFQAFWNQLANRFKSNEKVIFGIMNEPHDMPTSLVFANNQAAINGIRATGAKQLILAPGNDWTGGHSWTGHVNASSEYMYKLNDPAKNLAIEVHEYLDSDYSGTHAECTQPGPSNLAALTAWLKKYGLKAIVGETGGGQNANCYAQIKEMLNYLAANDEYIGWTGWAAGPLWGTFRSCCGDDSGNLEPGTKAGNGSIPGGYETTWANGFRPSIPKTLKRSPQPRGKLSDLNARWPGERQIIRTTTQECWIVRRPLSDHSADSFRYISDAHGRRGADLFMETTTAEGTSGMPQTTLVPPSILPPDFLDADIDDIVNLIADMLDRLTSHNDQIPLRPEALTRFHSRTPPGISIQDYLKRIVKYTNVEVGGIKLIELNVLEREFLEKIDWRLTCTREMLQEYYTNLVRTHSGRGIKYQMGEALAKNVRQDPVTLESYQANGNGPDKTTPSPPRSPATSTAPSSVHQVPCANAPPPPISTKPFAQPQSRDTVASPSRTILASVTSPSLRRAGRSPVTGPSRSIPSSPSLKRARDGTEDIMPSLTNAHLRKMEESSPRTRRRTGTNSS
ncbi:Cellulase (glycosyl hydrolase family 5), partial [Rhizoctonia solani]